MPTQISAPISAFLTNLRLLDLDYAEDWPAITPNLFATKDARANQKQRIRGVEWALYRLFELWNPKETKNKLQPFFPPYDALRSINLRAALFRSLNELKKNGVLGKEVVIRKTMFDECRGERFEELLASFSTIVLQDQLRKRPSTRRSFAGRLATSRELSGHAQRSALPLAIAHQGALKALLRRKEQLRKRYARLEDTLREKELELLKRVDDLDKEDQACPVDAVPDREVRTIRQQFDKSWQGDASWVDGIVEGDRRDFGDSLLDNTFSTVWTHAENGTIDDIGTTGQKSLFQDLNCRVQEQQSRLRHWQNVHKDLVSSRPRSPTKRRENTTPYRSRGPLSPLKFGNMEQKGVGESFVNSGVSPELKAEYGRLLRRARGDNEDAGFQDCTTPSKSLNNWDPSSVVVHPREERDSLSSTVDTLPSTPKTRTAFHAGSPERDLDPINSPKHQQVVRPSNSVITGTPEPGLYTSSPTLVSKSPNVFCERIELGSEEVLQVESEIHSSSHTNQGQGSSDHVDPKSPTVIGAKPLHEEDDLAQRIISSALDADASPTKPKISLMERTRQSIAFARPESFLPSPSPTQPLFPSSTTNTIDNPEPTALARTSSLLERTRRSISLLPTSTSDGISGGTRKSVHQRRQSKQYYPRNQFETPRKERLEEVKEMTPPEVLFSPEADYKSVFKSRPRVKTSPGFEGSEGGG